MEQQRSDVKHERQAWFDWQKIFDPARLVFIDETATSTAMARAYGRSERGTRCEAGVSLADRDVCGRPASQRLDGAHGTRWRDEWCFVSCLYRTDFGARTHAGRRRDYG